MENRYIKPGDRVDEPANRAFDEMDDILDELGKTTSAEELAAVGNKLVERAVDMAGAAYESIDGVLSTLRDQVPEHTAVSALVDLCGWLADLLKLMSITSTFQNPEIPGSRFAIAKLTELSEARGAVKSEVDDILKR